MNHIYEYLKKLEDKSINIAPELYEKSIDSIKNEIAKLIVLQDEINNCVIETFNNEKKQLQIDYCIKAQNKYLIRFRFVSYITDIYRNKCLISFNERKTWEKICELFKILLDKRQVLVGDLLNPFELNNREKMIAQVITGKYLGRYNLSTKNGNIVWDKIKIDKIIKLIENKIVDIGPLYIINTIFKILKINKVNNRYLLPRHFFNYTDNVEIAIPYHYIINTALNKINLDVPGKPLDIKKHIKLIDLVKSFIFLYDLQYFHRINPTIFPESYNVNFIHKNILYDHIFRFNQLNYHRLEYILENLVFTPENLFIEKELEFSKKRYYTLINKLFINHKTSPTIYSKDQFTRIELKILDKISHTEPINSGYYYPTDIGKINNPFFLKPLIKSGNNYILIDKSYCSWNFYEIILKLIGYKNINIGTNMESLLIKEFRGLECKIHFGEYEGSDRECDIVLEESDKIIFIEVKKKSITRNSITGDETQLAIDIVDMFIQSQEQALTHELFLKENQKINFTNGTSLNYNDREIIKISISLFDNYSLNDHYFSMKVLEFFKRIRFDLINDEIDSKELKKIKKEMEHRNSRINNITEISNKLYGEDIDEYRKNIFNIWFFSLEMVLYFINESKNRREPFSKIINTLRNISSGSGDVFSEYHYFSNLGK